MSEPSISEIVCYDALRNKSTQTFNLNELNNINREGSMIIFKLKR